MSQITHTAILVAITTAAQGVTLPHRLDAGEGWTFETWSPDEDAWMQGGLYDTRDEAGTAAVREIALRAWRALARQDASERQARSVIEETAGDAHTRVLAALEAI